MDTLRHLDDRILTDVNGFARHTGWAREAVLGYATDGLVLFAALLLAGLWLTRTGSNRALAAAGWACVDTLLAVGLNQPLVSGIGETRRHTTHPGLLVLATRSSDFSFPSDHAVMAGAAAAGLWLVKRTLGAVATAAALLMAFSRLYIAAYYPWDVLAGLVFGALIALVGWALLWVPLTGVTGWLRRQPGVRQAFPPSGARAAACRRAHRAGGVRGVSGLVHRILGLPCWLILLVAGLVVFSEDALFVGFVIPGETVALLAGAAAKLGHVSLTGVLIVVIVAAIVGDTVGYEIGRHVGPRVLQLKILQKRRKRVDDAQGFLARRGGSAVFLGRWVAFFRAVMPALAGTARMHYPKFLGYNAAGGLAWGVTVVLLGYAAGASYAKVEKAFGRDAAFVVVALVIVAVVVWRIREHRAKTEDAQKYKSGAGRIP